MKRTLLLLALLLGLGGCSFSGPTSTVKKCMSSAEKGDVATMTSLYSSKAIQKSSIEKTRAGDQSFSDLVKKAIARGEQLQMNDITESINGDSARVSFLYQDKDKVDSIRLGFNLSKENGSWKIDEIGTGTMEDPGEVSPPDITTLVDPVPPAPTEKKGEAETKSAPVSGGELNAKATKLPQPAYPAIAKQAHASGKVTVQVLVDETGKVVTANAISGHPLLHAAAVAAAKGAEFKPTILSGKPVKVTGIIVYDFVDQ